METLEAPAEPTPAAPPAAPRGLFALAGMVGAGVSLGFGELIDGMSESAPSLVISAGEWFRDAVPGDFAKDAIELFGEHDKIALVIGTTVTVLLIGAVVGLVARTRAAAPAIVFGVFGLIGGWLGARSPLAGTGISWVSSILSAIVGFAVTTFLLGRLRAEPAPRSIETPTNNHHPRRAFLGWAGGGATAAVGAALIGKGLREADAVDPTLDIVAADGATETVETFDTAITTIDGVDTFDDIENISRYLTPTDEFYRIDTALRPPQVDPDSWSLTIDGLVDNPMTLTLDDILSMDLEDHVVTLSCVSNEVGGELVGNAQWTGVRLTSLLEMAGVQPDAQQVFGVSVDGFTAGFPIDVLDDGRNAMLAIAMNGEPLPVIHGFPARLVVPGLYGYVSAVKWIERILLTTWDGADGYWIPRGWSKLGPIKTQSRIDVPRNGQRVTQGTVAVAGIAWAPTGGVSKVEVKVGDADWAEAELSGSVSGETWLQWMLPWDATPGDHVIAVRATNLDGETQSEIPVPVAPDGAEGYHAILVEVV